MSPRTRPLPARDGRMLRLPPRILLDVEAELGDYLIAELRRDWPQALVQQRGPGRPAVADLVVIDSEPARPTAQPTLWLADIDGSLGIVELAPGLWRTAMPTTAARLRRALEECLGRIA